MILVVGATGTNGREVVRRLVAAGQRVRAMVRTPSRAGDLPSENVELVQGDLDDPGSLDAALAGVERAFFVSAVDQRYVGWFGNLLAAAGRAGSPYVVKFLAAGKVAGTTDTVERITGRAPISFDQFARDHAAAFS